MGHSCATPHASSRAGPFYAIKVDSFDRKRNSSWHISQPTWVKQCHVYHRELGMVTIPPELWWLGDDANGNVLHHILGIRDFQQIHTKIHLYAIDVQKGQKSGHFTTSWSHRFKNHFDTCQPDGIWKRASLPVPDISGTKITVKTPY